MSAVGAFPDPLPFIASVLVICLGYAAGTTGIAGFSHGIGAVLFVGLAVGVIGPKASPPVLELRLGRRPRRTTDTDEGLSDLGGRP